ncbi:hypothetical protein [Paenisporosarcina sp.]|uniref:hypothetical protein n=1 Tax=Paenisporosarcina sp. TaxID=1932001 RepID=UPI003C759722
MNKQEKHEKEHVTFANNRLFVTMTLLLIIGIPMSFLPEESYIKWLFINIAVAIILTFINYLLWEKYQDDSKRYFSLHSLVMMLGMSFFAMAPVFKGLFPSIYFWLLLIGLGIFMAFLFSKSESIAEGFLNPKLKGFKIMIYTYFGIVFFAGSILWAYLLATEVAPWVTVAILTFFIGLFFVMVSPAMLITPERAIELRNRGNESAYKSN